MTYSLSMNHQKDIRAAVGIAPANYNIYVPPKNHQPIAWMQTTGMSDTTCPWANGSSTTQGAKYIAIEHGTDNGAWSRRPSRRGRLVHILRRLHGVHDGSAHQGLHLQRPPHEPEQRSGLQHQLDSPGLLEVLHAVLIARTTAALASVSGRHRHDRRSGGADVTWPPSRRSCRRCQASRSTWRRRPSTAA